MFNWYEWFIEIALKGVIGVATIIVLTAGMSLTAAQAASFEIDDSVEGQITLHHGRSFEGGATSNGTSFAPNTAGSTTVPGENGTFTGTWYVNNPGNPNPGSGIVYIVEPTNLNTVSDIITADWSTAPPPPYGGTATIHFTIQSSACGDNLGPLPVQFAGLGIPEQDGRTGILAKFRDPMTGDPVSLPSNLTVGFVTATCNVAPVADAGPNQSIHVGQLVELDGTASTDDNTLTEDLGYDWSFSSKPTGSTATLMDADTSAASFIADLPGDYVVNLVVTDAGGLNSDPDQVTVSSLNTPPTANAGPDQGGYVGETIWLDGNASSDPDFDTIVSYAWTMISQPVGSVATLSGAASATPTFIAENPGTYVVQLIVSDGYSDSTPDEVTVVIVTPEAYVETKTVDVLNVVSTLPLDRVTSKGNQQAMKNFLEQVVSELQKGNTANAIKKLEKAISHTDGCALRGAPDTGGGGGGTPPAKDILIECTDQATIYPALVESLDALTP